MGERPSHVAYELLARSHSPDTADRLFKERVVERPLLLRSAESTVNARAERRQKREEKAAAVRARQSKKPKPLSAKQKRALCIYDIPKEQQKYAIYEPLHEMWCAYMREVLDLDRKDSKLGHGEAAQKFVTVQVAGPKIVSADFHGAMVEVARSRCVSRVGLKGIVVKDTKHTFEMITATNKLKSECIMLLRLP